MAALPGFNRIDDLINVFGEQGAARALVGPFLTSGFQIADVLDDIQAAQNAGDTGRTLNAFVNGFTPSFSPGEWPSLLSGATLLTGSNTAPGGLQYALVTQVNDIIRALGGTPPPLQTSLPPATATPGVTGLNRAASQDTVTLEVPKTPETPEVKDDTKKAEDTTKLVSDTTGGNESD